MNVLTFDIGTTNIRAVYFSNELVVLTLNETIKTHVVDKKTTQNANEILQLVQTMMQKANAHSRVDTLVFSTPMHTLLYLDEHYNPIEEMILYTDRRSEHVFDTLSTQAKKSLYENTGTPLHSMNPLSKLMLHQDDFNYVCDLKAYLLVHLCGEFVSDYASASSSGLWNMHTKTWDKEALKLAHLNETQLPTLKEIDASFKCLNGETKIILGASDGVMATRFFNQKDTLVLNIGTSIGIRKLTNTKEVNGGFCYYAGFDQWLVGHASNNGGNLYSWLNKHYFNENLSFEAFVSILKEPMTPHFSIPFVFGERGPWWRDGLSHSIKALAKKDVAQSLIYAMFTNIGFMLEKMDYHHEEILLTGGFLSHPTLRKIFADYLECHVLYLEEDLSIHYALLELVQPIERLLALEAYAYEVNEVYREYRKKSKQAILNYLAR